MIDLLLAVLGKVLDQDPQVVLSSRHIRLSVANLCQLLYNRHEYGIEPCLVRRYLRNQELAEATIIRDHVTGYCPLDDLHVLL